MNVLITICARGGSKGIPGKNIKLLNGKPLLHYTLKQALEFVELYQGNVQLSTDSDEILACANELGYTTEYKRPDHLASDTAAKVAAIKDVWQWTEAKYGEVYDYVLDLDVTSPLRTVNDLEMAFKSLKSKPEALNIFSVNPAARNPYFNMVELGEDGYARVSKSAGSIKSRQQAPQVFDMNASFYFFSRDFLEGDYTTTTTERSLIHVMDHPCFDLDEPLDFDVMDLLLREGKLGFIS